MLNHLLSIILTLLPIQGMAYTGISYDVYELASGSGNITFSTPFCPPGYTYFQTLSRCFMVYQKYLSWYAARDLCSASGGWLATVSSPEMQAAIVSMASSPCPESNNWPICVWIGLSRINCNGCDPLSRSSFAWLHEEGSPYDGWDSTEPGNTAGNEECVGMLLPQWADGDCTGHLWQPACEAAPECPRGFLDISGECLPCQVGYSTVQGGDQCIAAETVHILTDKNCRGYKSIRDLLPANSLSIRYMPNTEEKMLVFSDVPSAFFEAVSTVDARFMISHHKVAVGGNSFANVLSKKQDYYDQRYLFAVPSYTGQTSFDLSFPSCLDQLLKPGQYIAKLRLIFHGGPPESMLTFDTIAGCKDYHLDPSSPFDVNEGVCMHNPQDFSLTAM